MEKEHAWRRQVSVGMYLEHGERVSFSAMSQESAGLILILALVVTGSSFPPEPSPARKLATLLP